MENDKAIAALNSLVIINNDRIEGYETAMKETEESDLRSLFARFAATSEKCREELVVEVEAMGGEASDGTMTSGKFFRMWMDVKAALTGKDRKTILNSCESGEDQALNTYEKALENDYEHLTAAQLTMIRDHESLLRADHDHIKALRDEFVEA